MSIPTKITDLSTTAASNSPAGSDSIGTSLDDYLRAIQAILRTESENKSWERWNDTPTQTSGTTFTVVGDLTSRYFANRRIKCIDSSTLYGTIVSASFGSGVTTVTVTLDSGSLSASLTEVQLGMELKTYTQVANPFSDAAALIKNSSDATKLAILSAAGITTGTARTYTLPDISDTLLTLTATQTLTNKSLSDSTTFIVDDGDNTKKAQFQASGISTGTTRTYTLPDKSGTVAMTSDIGTTGQILLSTQSVTGASSMNFTGFLTSTYSVYKLYLYDIVPASTGQLTMQFGISGTPITSGYKYGGTSRQSGGGSTTYNSGSDTKIQLQGDAISNSSTAGSSWEITIFNPSHSERTMIVVSAYYPNSGGSDDSYSSGGGSNTSTSAITDIQISVPSVNITGTGKLFGIK